MQFLVGTVGCFCVDCACSAQIELAGLRGEDWPPRCGECTYGNHRDLAREFIVKQPTADDRAVALREVRRRGWDDVADALEGRW